MTGYLIGKVVTVSGTVLVGVASRLIIGVILFSGLALDSAATWLTLLWVLLLGLLAGCMGDRRTADGTGAAAPGGTTPVGVDDRGATRTGAEEERVNPRS